MKKLLFVLLFCGGVFSSNAQNLLMLFEAWTAPNGQGLANQPVWVNVSSGTFGGNQYYFVTNANGQVYDTLQNLSTPSTITFTTYDCNGNLITSSKSITPNTSWTGDTLIVPCVFQNPCQALIHQISPNPSSLTLNLLDSSSTVSSSGGIVRTSYWDFGDGASGMGGSVSHTYAQAGVYTVCLITTVIDSIANTVLCSDTTCVNYTVGGSSPSSFCNASFWVDTLGSGSGNVNIYNTSTPQPTATGYQTQYSWDFGDGGTSNSAFPTHTYANAGTYAVCLTIISADAFGDTCIDTHCDTLGVDSLGNLIYKTSAGFTLNVLDPAAIGLNDIKVLEAKLFPNPASDLVNVDLGRATGEVKWVLFDLKGAQLNGGTTSSDNLSIDISTLEAGLYILSLETDKSVGNYKLIVE